MKVFQLEDMVKGWFVGDFEPAVIRSKEVEVAVKTYSAGVTEARHMHKVAPEVTVLVSGEVRMGAQHYRAGDIVLIEPSEATDFEALTEVTTVVVKLPSVAGDKYEC